MPCIIKRSTERLASTFSIRPSLRHTGSIIQPVDTPCCSAAPCCLFADIINKSRLQNSNTILIINLIIVPCIFVESLQIYQPTNAHIISHKTLLKHSHMFRSCQIIRELCSLLKLYYSIHNLIRICKRGVVAAYLVVWECVVEQWLGVRRTTHTSLLHNWYRG